MNNKIATARAHVEEAFKILTGEAYRGESPHKMKRVDMFCTAVADLRRIDAAIGPSGESIFAVIAQDVEAAYTEICAARSKLQEVRELK